MAGGREEVVCVYVYVYVYRWITGFEALPGVHHST